jgi:hypothetical protein
MLIASNAVPVVPHPQAPGSRDAIAGPGGLLAVCRNHTRMPHGRLGGIHSHTMARKKGSPSGVLPHGILFPNRRLYRDNLRLNP